MTPEFIQARIDFYEALIPNLETTILGLSQGDKRSYSLNTGQTTESVTKKDLTRLEGILQTATDRLEAYQQRLNGGSSVHVR